MMRRQKNATPSGRRTTKFTPENIQKIKDWVAEGISREEIAKLIDVTVGSLQVTCSRLGISLRTRQYSNGRGSHWVGAVGRPHIANHPPMIGHMRVDGQFQITLERGGMRRATDLPLTARDIAQLALAAARAKCRDDSTSDGSCDHGNQEGHDRRDSTQAVPGPLDFLSQ